MLAPGSPSAIASFVISVIRLSVGVIRTFTPKPAPTPAKAAARPGQRVAPDAQEGRRSQRVSG